MTYLRMDKLESAMQDFDKITELLKPNLERENERPT